MHGDQRFSTPGGAGHSHRTVSERARSTAEEIVLSLPDDLERIEKTAFSACESDEFGKKLDDLDVSQVILCGVETHVCVSQTAHDLLDAGI
jgi:nicotinamidase-related amidase